MAIELPIVLAIVLPIELPIVLPIELPSTDSTHSIMQPPGRLPRAQPHPMQFQAGTTRDQ